MDPDLYGSLFFGERLRASLQLGSVDATTLKVGRHRNIYNCGDREPAIYLIESGQVKIVVPSANGKVCLLAIYTPGDVFGESCLTGAERMETAIAMKDSVLKRMSCTKFLSRMSRDGMLQDFVRYMAIRIANQQQVISNLVTADCEYRLAATLLHLARKLGKQTPFNLRLEQKISHQELSEMVGTTRPHITELLRRFRERGLIETTPEFFLIVKENDLNEYLESSFQTHRRMGSCVNNVL